MYKIFWYYFETLEKRKIEGKHKKLKIFLFKRRLVLIKYSKISRFVSYKRKTKHFQRLLIDLMEFRPVCFFHLRISLAGPSGIAAGSRKLKALKFNVRINIVLEIYVCDSHCNVM